MKSIATIILVFVFISLVTKGVLYTMIQHTQTPQALATTNRNAFISGCKSEARKYPSVDAEAYCGCAYDKMLAMYPDFNTNTERENRIMTQGYNSTETDAILACVNQPTVQTN